MRIAALIIRILIGLLFIFSGFVKAVDPWGSAIKFGEYFSAFGMEWLGGGKYFFAVALSTFEMLLGFALLFNLRKKLATLGVVIFMSFFTLLTLYIFIENPVSDCGCFGDAIKLTNGQTFLKNLIILPLVVFLFFYAREEEKRGKALKQWIFIGGFAILSSLIGIYSLRHLPIIDFLPYKVGTNIPQAMSIPDGAPEGEYKTTLTYKNLASGIEKDFEVEDSEWQDTTKWEFIDAKTVEISKGYVPPVADFSIFSTEGNVTNEILTAPEDIYMFVIDDITTMTDSDREIMSKYSAVDNESVICVTTSPLENISQANIKFYNIDQTVLKTMLRSHKGLVKLKEGTIVAKYNMRDVPISE